ncbi:UNVERIFIED_CONTAM: hypothetical protein PYX00_006465 [Menopon gallinae]|uniref:Probable glycerol kinase n=2 Tax=Menopon gallinae TaxID=328185 RepID=A0AAW2HVA8_9NEOP
MRFFKLFSEMPVTRGRFGPLIGAIDEGTSSARFIVFSPRTTETVVVHQVSLNQIYPQEGWVEQDPMEIVSVVNQCIQGAIEKLKAKEVEPSDIIAVGITNQRETTIAWDKETGKPLHNAIVWLDMRTSTTVEKLLEKVPNQNQNHLKKLCGLPLSPYFSALKMRWMLDNVAAVKAAADEGRLCFGTVDSWLIYNLTGGKNGGAHLTDCTNASRTMLMNIETLKWDGRLCEFFEIDSSFLPEIRSSSEIYGTISEGPLKGVAISGCLGDQQAALFGQTCFAKGQAKSTYGTGCFLLYNTGTTKVDSHHGLLTTLAYQIGKNKPPVYALEGSVAIAGAAFSWLKDNINLLQDVKDIELLADKVLDSNDVYFVPAFSGLYAPYWRKDARGVIVGITLETEKAHIIRAALEAVCFQIRDILEAMKKDCGIPLTKLQVDGGMTNNNIVMQLQADLIGIPVVRPKMTETTALGVAMAAGQAEGIEIWDLDNIHSSYSDVFKPAISNAERDIRYSKWKSAVERSFDWDSSHS